MNFANIFRKNFVVILLTGFACGSVLGAEDAKESTALTIYSSATPGSVPPEMYQPGMQQAVYGAQWRQQIPGYAIVKQERPFKLGQGRSTIRFTDVASQIEPTTVSFASITDPTGTHVLEQNYEFDLVSTEKLMQR